MRYSHHNTAASEISKKRAATLHDLKYRQALASVEGRLVETPVISEKKQRVFF